MQIRRVILDTETTGLDPKEGHRIIEIGCLEMIDRKLTGQYFHAYLNPERAIDPDAAKITGLTEAFLKDKPLFAEVAEDFLHFIGQDSEVVIHNAPFDLGFLQHELSLLNHSVCSLEDTCVIVDTLLMARRLYPGRRNNLNALCERYGIDNSNRAYHGALLDAELLAKVYLAMTAGQTQLDLDDTLTNVETGLRPYKIKRMARKKNEALSVIYATKAELDAHDARMKGLGQV